MRAISVRPARHTGPAPVAGGEGGHVAPRVPAGRLAGLAVLQLCLVAVFAACGFHLMYSNFKWYDDQGYVMIAVRMWLDGHRLYDDVVTLYGPFFYLLQWVVHGVAGVPVTVDACRLCSLLTWLAMVVLVGLFVYSVTGRPLIAAASQCALFLLLNQFSYEPGHPQEYLLLACGLLLGAARWGPTTLWAAGVMGGVCASMALTKLNVGVFATAACVTALVPFARPGAGRGLCKGLVGLGTAALPLVLMWGHLSVPALQTFAGVVIVAGLGVTIVTGAAVADSPSTGGTAATPPPPPPSWKVLATFGAGGAVVAVVTLAVVMWKGTSLPAIVDAVWVRPKRMADNYGWPVAFPVYAPGVYAVSLVAAVAARRLGPLTDGGRPGIRLTVAGLKLGAGAATAWWGSRLAVGQAFCLLPATAWLAVVDLGPPGRRDRRRHLARLTLAWLAVLELLWAYPVAGTQVTCGLAMPTVTGFVNLADAVDFAAGRVRRFLPRSLLHVAVGWALCQLTVAPLLYVLQGSVAAYARFAPVGLPGTRWLRLERTKVRDLHAFVDAIARQCDTFVASDGFNTLYFWAGERPPSGLLVAHTLLFFTSPERQRLIDALRQHPRACLILQGNLTLGGGPSAEFAGWARSFYKPWFSWYGFTVMVRRDRPVPPVPAPSGPLDDVTDTHAWPDRGDAGHGPSAGE